MRILPGKPQTVEQALLYVYCLYTAVVFPCLFGIGEWEKRGLGGGGRGEFRPLITRTTGYLQRRRPLVQPWPKMLGIISGARPAVASVHLSQKH